MDINNQFDQELLSAYLDDALTASELDQVEQWLATDPAALAYLDHLRSNRSTLQALAALPVLGLKSSLAERVLAQALSVQPAQPSEQLVNEQTVRVPGQSSKDRAWWAWGSLVAAAAVVTWLAVIPLMRQSPQINALLPKVEEKLPDVPKEPKSSDIAKASAVDVVPTREPMVEPVTPGGKSVDNSRSTPEQRHQPTDFAPLQLIFIGDVVMSESAWNASKFDQLLESYGIRYERELVANRATIEGLIESQTIAAPDADPSNQQDAALIYIDCPALAMSKLLVKLENDGTDFLDFNFNMAMSGGGLGLPTNYDKLLKALGEQSASSPGRSTARLIVPEPSDALGKLLPKFEATKKSAAKALRLGAAELVEAGIQSKGNQTAENQNGQLLLILRKQ